jgi:hypothetical protein
MDNSLDEINNIVKNSNNYFEDIYKKYNCKSTDEGINIDYHGEELFINVDEDMLKPDYTVDFDLGDIVSFKELFITEGLSNFELVVTSLPTIDSRVLFPFSHIYDFDESCLVCTVNGFAYCNKINKTIPVGLYINQFRYTDTDLDYELNEDECCCKNIIRTESNNKVLNEYSEYVKQNNGDPYSGWFIKNILKKYCD